MFAWLNNVFLLKHHFIKMIVAEFFLGSLSISRAFSIERREYRTIWWNVENNLRATSCKILFVSLFLSFTPWHFVSTHLMHCNLVYAYLLGVSPSTIEMLARPLMNRCTKGKCRFAPRRCDIREQLRDWCSYVSAFSMGSQFVMELHLRE